jgi:hypothetical protein
MTTDYYVQSVYDFNTIFGGPLDNSIGSGGYFNANQHLIFDITTECKIVSAIVYADNANTITFELRDNNSQVINDTTITVVSGQQRLYFNFDVPVGNNYQLGVASNNSGLYRNNSGPNYPYNIGGILNITGSSASQPGYYYFFYDIEVKRESCVSNIEAVKAVINDEANTSQNFDICFGDTVFVASSMYLQSGTFVDTLAAFNSCDSIITTVVNVDSIGVEISLNNNQLTADVVVGSADWYLWSTGEVTPSISPLTSGVYCVVVADSNNCVSDTVCYEYISTPVLDQLKNSVQIFPNPTNGVVNISFYNNFNVNLLIYNVLGEKVARIIPEQEGAISIQFDMSKYASGVYFVEFRTNYGIMNYKVVLE